MAVLIWPLIAKLKISGGRQRQYCSSNARDAKLKSANYVQMAHSPNIILAKFPRLRYTCMLPISYLTLDVINSLKTIENERQACAQGL